jgi:hypothetical protein
VPRKNGKFSPQELKMIAASAAGLPPQEAARRAGYARPDVSAYQAIARPEILAAIKREQAAKLIQEGLPIAIATLIELASDGKQPGSVRIQASKVIVDRGLGSDDPAARKDPSEMTREELDRAIEALKRKAADAAKPVLDAELVPAPEPAPQNVLD